MTTAEACRRAEARLLAAGVSAPATDARLLAAHVLGVAPSLVPARYREPIPPGALIFYEDAIRRRVAREPLAYITGSTEFMGLPFLCDRRALVPRPDTETLVQATLGSIATIGLRHPLLADIGTGTGCVGISLLHALPDAHALLTDTSQDALELARRNAELNNVASRTTLLHGADLSPIQHSESARPPTVLVSNPPYIPAAEIAALEPEVRDHEPPIALDGGLDGLDAYRRILPAAGSLPSLQVVAFECSIGQAPDLSALMATHLPGWTISTHHDLSGIDRVLTAWRPEAAPGRTAP